MGEDGGGAQRLLDTRALEMAAGTEKLLEHHIESDRKREDAERKWRDDFRGHVDGKLEGLRDHIDEKIDKVHDRISNDKSERAARVSSYMWAAIMSLLGAVGVLAFALFTKPS